MPISFDDIEDIQPDRSCLRPGSDECDHTDALSRSWLTTHPESGGPFGGRDNALVSMLGSLRGRRIPETVALDMALSWNATKCDPPLPECEVREKVNRVWAQWPKGAIRDIADDSANHSIRPQRVVLTAADLLDLADSDQGTTWLVPNVFVRQGTHYISSPAGVAKSWLMQDLARCITHGLLWLGTYPVTKGAVLYIDEEMGRNNTAHRVRLLGFEQESPFYYLGKQGIRLNDPGDVAYIVEQVKSKSIVLVCVDTLTATMPGMRENDAEAVSRLCPVFNTMTQAGATVIVAHHDRKGGQGDDNAAHARMAGSRDLAAMSDMSYGIDKHGSRFHLTATKNRHLPEDATIEIDFVIENNADDTHVTLRIVRASEILDERLSRIEAQIVEVLTTKGTQNTRDINEHVSGKNTAIGDALKRLLETGTVVCTKAGNAKEYSIADCS